MSLITRFEDIQAWQEARKLVKMVYQLTCSGRLAKDFGLRDQIQRAAVSSMANIAEGFKKRGTRDKANFYNVAQGSLEELRYYFLLSKDLGYLSTNDELMESADTIGRMLHGLVSSVRSE